MVGGVSYVEECEDTHLYEVLRYKFMTRRYVLLREKKIR